MEDELERNCITLFKIDEELQISKNETQFLYVFTPDDEKIENYIITHSCEMLNNLTKGKNGRIQFFKKDAFGLYKFYNK
jgi:hypothetical protein